MNTRSQTSIWNPTFLSVFLVNFSLQMGQYMMNTLIPKYAAHLGAAASVVGLVSSIFALTALAIRPVSGPAFDYFSKKRLLTLTTGIIAAAFVGYSLSSSVAMVIFCRLLHGVGVGCTAPLALAIASDALPEEKMGSGLGIFSLAQAVSSAIGPSIGLSLSDSLGYNKTFAIGAVLVALSCGLTNIIREPERKTPRGAFRITPDRIIAREAVIPAVIMAFLSMSYACINAFIALYGESRGVEHIGLYFTVYAVFLLMSRPLSGTIADRFGLDRAIVPACLFFAASFFLLSRAASLPAFLSAAAVSAFGYGACQPAIQALCMRCVSKERRGVGANTNYFGTDVGQLLGPSIAGRIAESVQASGTQADGYAMVYRCMIVPILIAMGLFLINRRRLLEMSSRQQN